MIQNYYICDVCGSVGQSEEYGLDVTNFFTYSLHIGRVTPDESSQLNQTKMVCKDCYNATNISLNTTVFSDLPLEG